MKTWTAFICAKKKEGFSNPFKEKIRWKRVNEDDAYPPKKDTHLLIGNIAPTVIQGLIFQASLLKSHKEFFWKYQVDHLQETSSEDLDSKIEIASALFVDHLKSIRNEKCFRNPPDSKPSL